MSVVNSQQNKQFKTNKMSIAPKNFIDSTFSFELLIEIVVFIKLLSTIAESKLDTVSYGTQAAVLLF